MSDLEREMNEPMTEAEVAWVRACREGDFELSLKKRQYIWEMMRNKDRVGVHAKMKAKTNFEDAVLRYAEYIQKCREVTDDHFQRQV